MGFYLKQFSLHQKTGCWSWNLNVKADTSLWYISACFFLLDHAGKNDNKLEHFLKSYKTKEDKGVREGIPHTHPIPWAIRLELFLEWA